MRHRIIKKLINDIYTTVYGIHVELEQNELYLEIGNIGNNSWIDYPFNISNPKHISLGYNTKILHNCRLDCSSGNKNTCRLNIGNNCYICYDFSALVGENITIGDDVLIASGVMLCSHNHGINPMLKETYMEQPLKCAPISIGNGTWIGQNVIVLSGVSIGKKCVIGSGAVVTKSIPDYSIAIGIPARVIKTFNFETNTWEWVGRT